MAADDSLRLALRDTAGQIAALAADVGALAAGGDLPPLVLAQCLVAAEQIRADLARLVQRLGG
jgi:hypothetical protein